MTWEAPSGGGGSSSWTIVSEEHNDTNPTGGSHAAGTTYNISAYTYSLSLINTDDNVRLCKASRCDNVIMYAYNKALLPVNILATIPQ